MRILNLIRETLLVQRYLNGKALSTEDNLDSLTCLCIQKYLIVTNVYTAKIQLEV